MRKVWVHLRSSNYWEALYLNGELKDSFDSLSAADVFDLLLEDPSNYFEFTSDWVDSETFSTIGFDAFPKTINKSDIGKYER